MARPHRRRRCPRDTGARAARHIELHQFRYRLAGALQMRDRGRRLAVIAYAASPLMLGAFGGGRLPDLVLIALAPVLLLPILRAAGGWADAGWRSVASGVAGLAIATSLAPWS